MRKLLIGIFAGLVVCAAGAWAVGPVPFDIINLTTGLRIGGAATSGEYLRGDGTNFVSNTVQVADLPAGHVNATTDLAGALCGTSEILEDQGGSWACIATPSSTASPLTTKGDVYTFSTVDARLGVGANGTVLTADSAEATGLKWAAAGAGDITDVWGCTTGNCDALTAAAGDTLDAANADSTRPMKTGTTPPGTCAVGDTFFETDVRAGFNVVGCVATNTFQRMNSTVLTTSTAGADLSTTTTEYHIPNAGAPGTAEADRTTILPSSAVRNLYCKVSVAPGGAATRVMTVRKNTAATAVTCTISGASTTCSDTSNSVTFAAFDQFSIESALTGTPAAGKLWCSFGVFEF